MGFFPLFFYLLFLHLLLITNDTSHVSSSHHCEEPGPDVPDDLLAGMKELLLGPPEPFLRDEAIQLFPPPFIGLVLLTTLGFLCWACFQLMFFMDQGPKTRHSILDTARIITSL